VSDDARLEVMRHRFSVAVDAYSSSREDELDDLRFAAGNPDNNWQWPADVLSTRGSVQGQTINARPCLTINKLPQHIKQVTNDQRQNRPSGKVIPADEKADVEVARILDDMVRYIEVASDADVAYDTACENQVTFGEGYIRLLTVYCDDDSFDQDIRIGRIRNAFSVYLDPTAQDPCGSDAGWGFITDELLTEEFERLYPKAKPISSIQQQGVGDQSMTQWISDETVRIVEYFYIEHQAKTLEMYPGNHVFLSDSPESAQAKAAGHKPIKTRPVDVKTVKWVKSNGYEILEETEWAGRWIPIVRVLGNEFEVDGEIQVSGIVRNAKDAQRMYNYWVSQEAEMLALAPKAPFIGYGGQFEGYEQQWKTANTTNWPYLEVNPDVTDGEGHMLPLPQRSPPPMAQTGLIQAKMGASDDIKATTGQYDSSLGATSNERSGKAILAREHQTDTGTYHYVDNLARAVRYLTRQIVDIIPKIYDTQRIARIVGIDGETDVAHIDPSQPVPVREEVNEQGIALRKIYNPGVGKYDVVVTTGPSYMTKRQEAMDAMSQILQGNPQLWSIAGDLFVKNMDWPGAEELAERLQKTIDPKLLADQDQSPELQAAQQQIQQMGQEMEQMHQMLKDVSKSMEAQELAIKAYDAETKRITATMAGMTEEQIQEVVRGTIHGMLDSGDLTPQGAMLGGPDMGGAPPPPGPDMGGAPPSPPPGVSGGMPPGLDMGGAPPPPG
jgi:Phage P22-like portal protein